MKKTKKFIVKNATITIDNATTLQFNNHKSYKVDAPFIFTTAYKCGNYVLLHELQGYSTDKVIEPNTSAEFIEGLLTMDNPYYIDFYHMLHDKIHINSEGNDFILVPSDSYDGEINPYKDKDLKSFHLFEATDDTWNEVEFNIEELYKKSMFDWNCFASGMIINEKLEAH